MVVVFVASVSVCFTDLFFVVVVVSDVVCLFTAEEHAAATSHFRVVLQSLSSLHLYYRQLRTLSSWSLAGQSF